MTREPKTRALQTAVLATLLAVSLAYHPARTWADNRTYVRVTDQAWVKGEKVYLKDIATIAGPPRVRERLGSIYVAYAPRPGGHKLAPSPCLLWSKQKLEGCQEQ